MSKVTKDDGRVVVKPEKDVVASMVNDFRAELHALVQEQPAEMTIDMEGVSMVDSVGIGVIIAGTPTASAAYIMAAQLKSDAELSGSIIMLSTLFSLFTFTVSLYLLSHFNL